MERKELEAQVIELVAAAYNRKAEELSVETSFAEELKGASIQMVGLVSEIENELDVLVQLPVASGGTHPEPPLRHYIPRLHLRSPQRH